MAPKTLDIDTIALLIFVLFFVRLGDNDTMWDVLGYIHSE